MEWFDTRISISVPNGGQGTQNLNQPLDDEKKGATVRRLIVDFHLISDTVSAIADTDFGLAFIEDDALSAAALPDVDVETQRAGWLFRGQKRSIGLTANQGDGIPGYYQADMKLARRYGSQGETLVLIADQQSSGGTVSLIGLIRMLIAKA